MKLALTLSLPGRCPPEKEATAARFWVRHQVLTYAICSDGNAMQVTGEAAAGGAL